MIVPTPQFRIEPGGYAVEDVDALLNQFFAVLKSDPSALTGAGLRGVRFRTLPSRPGYSPHQVDAWVDAVAGQLDELPYDQPERSSPEVSENHPTSRLAGPIDPGTDPGRNAVMELPATPAWASVTVLIVLLAMISYFVVGYFR